MEDIKERHALLSPSAAHRWLNCPAAPRLEEGVEDKGSEYAAEGTLAHAYCAKKLKTYLGQPVDGEDATIGGLAVKYHTGEMDEYTDTYKTIVLEKLAAARAKTADALLLVETRLDFGKYIPDAFGTADAIIIADGTLDVIDFKYGKGVRVSADHNPQMMIYALGAWDKFSFEYAIDTIRMTIVQPRIDNLSEWELSVNDLRKWAEETLAPKAKLAYSGAGPQVPGEWCQFCRVRATCKALAQTCISAAEDFADLTEEDLRDDAAEKNGRRFTADEIAAKVLPKIGLIKAWLKDVEDWTLSQALAGVSFKGFKLVAGRSVRKITDQDGAAQSLLTAGYSPEDIYKPKELCGITDLERLCGKKHFAELCGSYIEKPQGKPALAPESDKRPAYDPAAEDFKDINLKDE